MTAPTVYNFQSGSLSAQAVLAATTLQSDQFADLPTISTPDTMYLTLDPAGDAGDPELVLVTNHTALSTSVTVTRARQTTLGGGAARQHEIGTAWVASLSALDARAYIEVAEAGTGLTQRPTLNFGDGLLAADDTTQTTVSVAFDSTNPAALGTADDGTAVVPARRDHVHPTTGLVVVSSFDAAGDLLIGTGADAYARLARGTEDQVLKGTATTVGWGELDTLTSFADPIRPVYASDTSPGSPADGWLWFNTADTILYMYSEVESDWYPVAHAGGGAGYVGGVFLANQDIASNSDVTISWDSASTNPTSDWWSAGSPTLVTIPQGFAGVYTITASAVSSSFLGTAYLGLALPDAMTRRAAFELVLQQAGNISATVFIADTSTFTAYIRHTSGTNPANFDLQMNVYKVA